VRLFKNVELLVQQHKNWQEVEFNLNISGLFKILISTDFLKLKLEQKFVNSKDTVKS
jgi:hypothetical protein